MDHCSSHKALRSLTIINSPYGLKPVFKLVPPVSSAKYFNHLSSFEGHRSLNHSSQKFSRFLQELESYELPESLVQVYSDLISSLPGPKRSKFMQEEINSLKNNRSLVQIAVSSYNLWKKSIEEIKQLETAAVNDGKWRISPVFISKIISQLTEHAYLALVMAENILAWEESVKSLFFPAEESIDFVIDDKVVLSDLIGSCDFLLGSEFKSYFSFSMEDPFLLAVSKINTVGSRSRLANNNLHSARDCKELLYLELEKSSFFKMKKLSKLLLGRSSNELSMVAKKNKGKIIVLPNIAKNSKVAKRSLEKPLSEQILYGILDFLVREGLEELMPQYLAEQIARNFWTVEVQRQTVSVADFCYKEETKRIEAVEVRKKENLVIGQQVFEELFGLVYFFKLPASEFCERMIEEVKKEERVKKELRIKAENICIGQEICEEALEQFFELGAIKTVVEVAIAEMVAAKKAIEAKKLRISEENTKIALAVSENLLELAITKLNLQQFVKDLYNDSVTEQEKLKKLEKSSKNANNLVMLSIYQSIARNLIELHINSTNLSLLCEEIIESELKLKESKLQITVLHKLNQDKLTLLLFEALIEKFVEGKWLMDLCQNMLKSEESHVSIYNSSIIIDDSSRMVEKPEEYVLEVFTPGIHSPNEVSLDYSHEYLLYETQSLPKPTPVNLLDFAKNCSAIKNPIIQPMVKKASKLRESLGEYWHLAQKHNKGVLYFGDELFQELEHYWNSRYFWVVEKNCIVGLLVMSEYTKGKIINHLSVIDSLKLEQIYKFLPALFKLEGNTLQIKFKTLPGPPLLSILKQQAFTFHEDSQSVLFSKKQHPTEDFSIQISSSTSLRTTFSPTEPSLCLSETHEICNRLNQVSILSSILAQNPLKSLPDPPEFKLQEDLHELLELTTYTPIPKFPQHTTTLQSYSQNSSIFSHSSSLSLNLNIFSCNCVSQDIQSSIYKYLLIPSRSVKVRYGQEGCRMFIVETSEKEISLVFYDSKELREEMEEGSKLNEDLFYYLAELMKSLDDPEEFCKDLWIPCFRLQGKWDFQWIKGFYIEDDVYGMEFVDQCVEEFVLEIGKGVECNQTLVFDEKKVRVGRDFIFGVVHLGVFAELGIPLVSALVKESDWIQN